MIYLECRPDYALVRALTHIPKRDIIHDFKGKFEVCKRLEKSEGSKGLIDEDPSSFQPRYIRSLKQETDLSNHDINIRRDSTNGNLLIILRPRLEEWILGAALEAGRDVRTFGLPNNGKQLHQIINVSLDKFENLLEELKTSDRLKTLKRLLERK